MVGYALAGKPGQRAVASSTNCSYIDREACTGAAAVVGANHDSRAAGWGRADREHRHAGHEVDDGESPSAAGEAEGERRDQEDHGQVVAR